MKKARKAFDPVRAYFQASYLQALTAVILAPLAIFVVGVLAFKNYITAAVLTVLIGVFVVIRNRKSLAFHHEAHMELRGGRTARATLENVALEVDMERTVVRKKRRNGIPWNMSCIRCELKGADGTVVRLSAWREDATPPDGPVPEGVTFEVEYLENTRVVTAITHSPAENEEQQEWLDKFRECFKQYFE